MAEIPDEAAAILERARADGIDVAGPHAHDVDPDDPGHANGDAPPGSLLADLRAQQHRLAQRKHTIIEFPYGLWAGKLAARYRLLDERALGRTLKAIQTAEGDALLEANADILVSACDEVLGRRDTDEPWGEIVPDERFRFDKPLANALGLHAETARQVLYALVGGRVEGAGAINDMSSQYVAWWQGKTPEVVSDLRGESGPTT
jgi:hypothetical protein